MNLPFLLQNLLDLVLSAELVKEVPRETWNVLQLPDGLDPIVQVSVLLKNKSRLWADRW